MTLSLFLLSYRLTAPSNLCIYHPCNVISTGNLGYLGLIPGVPQVWGFYISIIVLGLLIMLIIQNTVYTNVSKQHSLLLSI